jgi:hypothetical protein
VAGLPKLTVTIRENLWRILDDHHFQFRGEGGVKGGRIKLGG